MSSILFPGIFGSSQLFPFASCRSWGELHILSCLYTFYQPYVWCWRLLKRLWTFLIVPQYTKTYDLYPRAVPLQSLSYPFWDFQELHQASLIHSICQKYSLHSYLQTIPLCSIDHQILIAQQPSYFLQNSSQVLRWWISRFSLACFPWLSWIEHFHFSSHWFICSMVCIICTPLKESE